VKVRQITNAQIKRPTAPSKIAVMFNTRPSGGDFFWAIRDKSVTARTIASGAQGAHPKPANATIAAHTDNHEPPKPRKRRLHV
jgi:hypothetical protein